MKKRPTSGSDSAEGHASDAAGASQASILPVGSSAHSAAAAAALAPSMPALPPALAPWLASMAAATAGAASSAPVYASTSSSAPTAAVWPPYYTTLLAAAAAAAAATHSSAPPPPPQYYHHAAPPAYASPWAAGLYPYAAGSAPAASTASLQSPALPPLVDAYQALLLHSLHARTLAAASAAAAAAAAAPDARRFSGSSASSGAATGGVSSNGGLLEPWPTPPVVRPPAACAPLAAPPPKRASCLAASTAAASAPFEAEAAQGPGRLPQQDRSVGDAGRGSPAVADSGVATAASSGGASALAAAAAAAAAAVATTGSSDSAVFAEQAQTVIGEARRFLGHALRSLEAVERLEQQIARLEQLSSAEDKLREMLALLPDVRPDNRQMCAQCLRARPLHTRAPLCMPCVKHNGANMRLFREAFPGIAPSMHLDLFVFVTLRRHYGHSLHRCFCEGGPMIACNCVAAASVNNKDTCVPCRFLRGLVFVIAYDMWCRNI